MLQLTPENYYSTEANQEYMSVSQYKDFRKCESQAMAKIWGGFEVPPSQAFLVGSYVHSWNDNTTQQFMSEHPEIFKKDGDLKAEYKIADKMIEILRNDPMCMAALEGEKEKIIVAEFGGCKWKMKADSLNLAKQRIVDLKTTRDIYDKLWSVEDRMYVSWVEYYGHITQMAVYRELVRISTGIECEPLIEAVSKEDVPDKAIICFDNERLQYETERVLFYLPRILKVKTGEEEPTRCERCDWCKQTKKVDKVLHYSELIV